MPVLLVELIKAAPDANHVLETIYEELVLPCVRMIENQDYVGAHALYRTYVLKLKTDYLA